MKRAIIKTILAVSALLAASTASANCYTANNAPCYPQHVVTIPGEVVVHRTIHRAPPPVVVQEAPIHTYVDVYEQPRQFVPPPQQMREITTVVDGQVCVEPIYSAPQPMPQQTPVYHAPAPQPVSHNPMQNYHVPGYNNQFAPKVDFDRYGNQF